MDNANIKIEIKGAPGSGKTQIALLIKDTLAQYGIDIELRDDYDEHIPTNIFRNHREVALKSISENLGENKIALDMKNGGYKNDTDFKSNCEHKVKEYTYVEESFEDKVKNMKHVEITDFDLPNNKRYLSHTMPIQDIIGLLNLNRDVILSDLTTYDDGDNCLVYKSRFTEKETKRILSHKGYKNPIKFN